MNLHSFWKKYAFAVDQTLVFKAGYVEVFVKRIPNGWLVKKITSEIAAETLMAEAASDLVDDQEVLHFYTGNSNELLLVPALPDKAVVFRNNKNIKISAGEWASLFFRIPLTMQFYFQEVKDENRLVEIPLQRLSDTWFGEIDNGEPAYSIGSNYDQSFSGCAGYRVEAISSVEIINNTASVLDLQRLILRVENFNLYLKNKQILTSYVTIEFEGAGAGGNVNVSTREDIHGKNFELIARSRLSDSKKLLRRSFLY